MFLLTYARNAKGWRTSYAHFAKAPTLLAAVTWGFAATAEQALRTGPIRGYRRLEEASSVVRGRLRLGEQLARGGLPMPVLIAREEYDIDVTENRVLHAAARLLSRLPLVATTVRARLRRVIRLLDGVTPILDFRSLRPPPITRLNAHYEPALVLADLVLRNTSVSTRAGVIRSVTFAFELHRVFEDSSRSLSTPPSALGEQSWSDSRRTVRSTTRGRSASSRTSSSSGTARPSVFSMQSSSVWSRTLGTTRTSCSPICSSSGLAPAFSSRPPERGATGESGPLTRSSEFAHSPSTGHLRRSSPKSTR